MNGFWAVLFLGLSALLLGCPHRVDFGKEGPITDPKALEKLIQQAEERVIAVKGESKIKVESPQGNGVVTLFIALQRPGLVHLESLDFFGKPQAVLISDGKRFGLYQSQEGKYYEGPASAENLSRFLPIVLPPEELVALMLGQAPRIPADSESLIVDEDKKVYVLRLTKGPVTQTLEVDPKSYRVKSSKVRGVNAYDLAFDDFDDSKGAIYPRKVQLIADAAKTKLELLYKDVEVNPEPDLTLFDMEPPANVPVVEVDEKGAPVGEQK
ncbi:MAG: DUF4292 domain-containing protein [Myxococcaceae bacterium]